MQHSELTIVYSFVKGLSPKYSVLFMAGPKCLS